MAFTIQDLMMMSRPRGDAYQQTRDMISDFQNRRKMNTLSQAVQGAQLSDDPTKQQLLGDIAAVDPMKAISLSGIMQPDQGSGLTAWQEYQIQRQKQKDAAIDQADLFYKEKFKPLFDQAIQDGELTQDERLNIQSAYQEYKSLGGMLENPLVEYRRGMKEASMADKRAIEAEYKDLQKDKLRQSIEQAEITLGRKLNKDENELIQTAVDDVIKEPNARRALLLGDISDQLESFSKDAIRAYNEGRMTDFATLANSATITSSKIVDPNSAVLTGEVGNLLSASLTDRGQRGLDKAFEGGKATIDDVKAFLELAKAGRKSSSRIEKKYIPRIERTFQEKWARLETGEKAPSIRDLVIGSQTQVGQEVNTPFGKARRVK